MGIFATALRYIIFSLFLPVFKFIIQIFIIEVTQKIFSLIISRFKNDKK